MNTSSIVLAVVAFFVRMLFEELQTLIDMRDTSFDQAHQAIFCNTSPKLQMLC